MTSLLAQSKQDKQAISSLVHQSVPTHRRAYSDRMAWIMACCADLAYVKYNPLLPEHLQQERFIKQVETLLGSKRSASVELLISTLMYDHEANKKQLEDDLGLMEMTLIATYDKEGTQAILIDAKEYLVLAFRGTEPTSIRDIRSDASGKLISCPTGGKIHQGFFKAYELVADEIDEDLSKEENANRPLFITGHSLGGALATLATKRIQHPGGIAACYTFGSPRVGNTEWVCSIKDPVYRVVNAADAVTMLPPGDTFVSVLGWLVQFLPQVGKSWRTTLTSYFGGYMHGGDMRYLENIPPGEFDKSERLYAVSLFYRIKGMFFFNRFAWGKPLADHSMSTYRNKLQAIALRRNAQSSNDNGGDEK